MAVFNPSIPETNAPDFLSASKGTSQTVDDRTAATAVKGLSDLFGTTVTAIDTGIKEHIKDDIYSNVDNARNQYMAQLQRMTGAQVGNTDNANPVTAPKQDLPPELKNMPAQLDQLEGGKKFGMTYYLQRLDTYAKQMRTNYPGYVEYIDQEMKRASGKDVANSLIESRIQDLNAMATQGNSDRKAAYSFLNTEDVRGLPNWDMAIKKVDAGEWGQSEVMRWAFPRLQRLNQMRYNKIEREDKKGQTEMIGTDVKDEINQHAFTTATSYFTDTLVALGYDTKDKQDAFLQRLSTGGVSGPEAQKYAEVLKVKKQQAYNEIWNFSHNDKDRFGKSRANYIGNDQELKNAINSGLTLFDEMGDTLTNDKSGVAFRNFNASKRIMEDIDNRLLTDKDIGPYVQVSGVIKNRWGDQSSAQLTQYFLRQGLQGKLGVFVENQLMNMSTQPNGPDKPVTLNETIKRLQDNKIESRKANAVLIDYGMRIKDKNLPAEERANLVKAYFGPGNEGSISKFIRDQRDPQTGAVIPGQFHIFGQLTSPDMTKAIKELDKSNPGTFDTYRNWVEQTFAKELFPRELSDLRDFSNYPNLKWSWNATQQQFDVKYVPPKGGDNGEMSRINYQHAVALKDKINLGLLNLKSVAENGGMPVDSYLLQTLKDMQAPDMIGMPNVMFKMLGNSLLKSSGRKMEAQ